MNEGPEHSRLRSHWQMSKNGQGRRYRGGASSCSALDANGRTLCFWLIWEALSSFGQRMGNAGMGLKESLCCCIEHRL